jgi:phosphoribosylformylglycinamidine synthase
MRIDLDKVPTRQSNMKTWELLLSESQERMLMVVEKGKEPLVQKVFEKWDLPCSEIGEVTDDGMLRFYMHGQLDAEMPAEALVLGGGAPQYDRAYQRPAYFNKIDAFDLNNLEDVADLKSAATALVQIPNIASKRWIYKQYDSMVGTANMSTNYPTDAPLVWIKDTNRALAVTVDCNSRYVFADPYKGAMIAVSEAARNIVCSGAVPLGVTNCLNFGNPYDSEVYYQFVHAIKGMGDACRKFDTPVTGGNVSFYNQNPEGPVYPTPTIGMVGLLEDLNHKMTLSFQHVGDIIVVLGVMRNDVGSSEYLQKIKGVEYSPAPHFDLEEEFELQQLVKKLIRENQVNSVHDISEGGLIVNLLESSFYNNLGFEVKKEDASIRNDAYWLGEAQSRVVVTIGMNKLDAFKHSCGNHAFSIIGNVTENTIKVDGNHWGQIEDWKNLYDTSIEKYMGAEFA